MMTSARVLSPLQICGRHSLFRNWVQKMVNDLLHAQENKEAAREKALQVSEKLRSLKIAKAVKKAEDGIEETLTYMDFPT